MVRYPPGFFYQATLLELDDGYVGPDQPEWAEYCNVPHYRSSRTVGAVISAGKATLHELQTVYGVADLYMIAEILKVDSFNQRLANRWAKEQEENG